MLSYFFYCEDRPSGPCYLLYLHLLLQIRSVIVTRSVTAEQKNKQAEENIPQCIQQRIEQRTDISPTGFRCRCRLVLFHHSMAAANCQLTSKGGRLLMFLLCNFGPANERVLGFNGILRDCGTKNHNCKKHREETVSAEHGYGDLSVLFFLPITRKIWAKNIWSKFPV